MNAPLQGLRILLPESRELDLFAGMLEAEGARTLRCPMVRILDLADTGPARAWLERLMAGAFQDVVWLTGEGVRRLKDLAAKDGRENDFVAALARTRAVTRGPKPAQALRELGLSLGLAAKTPTSQGVLEALAQDDLAGRSMGVQLYPGAGPQLCRALERRGARTAAVTPYRYASEAENTQVTQIIGKMASGDIDLVAFTATPQIDRLFAVAKESGTTALLSEGLARTAVAAIGPVVEESLRARGISAAIRPQSRFHLKPLVRAIVAWKAT